MKKRYHINKYGIPAVCSAKPGNCPYGGSTGEENHYKTFEEAQQAAQELMSDTYGVLPGNEKISSEERDREVKKMADSIFPWDGLTIDSPVTEFIIFTTEDHKLIDGMLTRKSSLSDNEKNIAVMLQNPHIPRDFIEKVVKNPNDFTVETQRNLMLNTAIIHEDIMSIVDKSDDITARALALRNPNLSPEFAKDFVENREDDLQKLPWSLMLDNEGLDYNLFVGFMTKVIKREKKVDELAMLAINKEYKPRTKYEESN